MNNQEKEIILKIQTIIDIILEGNNAFAIDSSTMIKLNEYLSNYSETFNEEFIWNYVSFIEMFNEFVEFLLKRLEVYEHEMIISKEILSDCFFTFNIQEFYEKEALKPFSEMIDILENIFCDNPVLQGLVLYIHLNSLLSKHKFVNNKIKLAGNLPIIEIDYTARINYYKEEYITIFRQELEEGIRNSVFVDEKEAFNYAVEEIRELKNEFRK